MLKDYFTLSVLLFGLIPCVQAEEVERKSDAWITEFFQKGIMSAFAEYNLKLPPPQNPSPNYYKRMSYSVEYSRFTNTYSLRFVYEYRDDWNVLTDNGNHPPAQEQAFQNGSKIQPWSNSNGLGSYIEVYHRSIPNWIIFQNLDSLLIMQGKLGNPLPPLTGLFHADELKEKSVSRSLISFVQYVFVKPSFTFLNLFFRHKGFIDGVNGFLWSFFSALHFPIAYFKYVTSGLK